MYCGDAQRGMHVHKKYASYDMHVYIYIYICAFVYTVWCTVNVYRFPAKSGMPRRL